ncbi:uridine kinase family protein [Streptococcus cameli]
MEKDLLADIVAWCQKRDRTVIRICGHGASGKTTFAKKLMDSFPEGRAQLVETDAYVISNAYSKDAVLEYELDGQWVRHAATACHPVRHELIGLKRDLSMLEKGMDLLTPEDLPWMPANYLKAACPVTIVEGMTPTFLDKDLFDLSLFFYTDAETELTRRLARDTKERGRKADFVTETHAHRRRQYDLFMAHYKDEFDIIVNQSGNRFTVEKKTRIS